MGPHIATVARRLHVALNLLGMILWLVGVEPIDWRRGGVLTCLGGGDMVAGGALMLLLGAGGLLLNGAWFAWAGSCAWRGRWTEASTLLGVVVAWLAFFIALRLAIPRLPWC